MENKPAMPGIPPLTYGVWIEGRGWLRDAEWNHVFADPRIEYAKAALRMWMIGGTGPARVELIDESMIGLQSTFLERERLRDAHKELAAKLSFKQKLRRWINGILG
jgi:hypothetical protein